MRKRKLSRDYQDRLDALVDQIFEEATYRLDWSWNDLADEAGMCRSTVTRLGNRETRLPQLHTMYRLAKAVGMDVSMVKAKMKLRVQRAA